MRLVIVNPHGYLLGKQLFQWMFDYHQLHTYSYILDVYSREKPRELAFFLDGEGSSFSQTSYYKRWKPYAPFLFRLCSYVEFFLWLALNRISPFRHRIYFSLKRLEPRTDVILMFAFAGRNPVLWQYRGVVAVHLTHYHHETEAFSAYIKKLQHPFLLAESDLTKNDYFRVYFPYVSRVHIVPFVFTRRFKKLKPFQERSSQCFASGSMSVPSAPSYVRYYGPDAALQPMRKLIYDHQDVLKDSMDIYMYPHTDALAELKTIYANDSFIVRCIKHSLPASVLKKIFHYQQPYFRFNIIDKYNEYQMFMSPEERTGLPSLKMFEGIRCGSVLVGIDHPMYGDIGFKNGINYIAYRANDMQDMLAKIKYYQTHPDQLAVIAETGYEFVTEHFAPHVVAMSLWISLEQALSQIHAL